MCCLLAGGVTISFNPFSIQVDSWMKMLAFVLISSGIICLSVVAHSMGYMDGIEAHRKVVIETLEELKTEMEANAQAKENEQQNNPTEEVVE